MSRGHSVSDCVSVCVCVSLNQSTRLIQLSWVIISDCSWSSRVFRITQKRRLVALCCCQRKTLHKWLMGAFLIISSHCCWVWSHQDSVSFGVKYAGGTQSAHSQVSLYTGVTWLMRQNPSDSSLVSMSIINRLRFAFDSFFKVEMWPIRNQQLFPSASTFQTFASYFHFKKRKEIVYFFVVVEEAASVKSRRHRN